MWSLLLPLGLLCPAGAAPLAIPAGSLQQGSPGPPDEHPRTVTLSAFRIDATEVSIADYEAFVAEGGYANAALWSEAGNRWRAQHPAGAGADHRAAGRSPDHPVVAVTFYEAEAYCRSRGGALPTEAQWERAACGEGGRRFPWGDREDVDAAWYAEGKFGHLGSVHTRPVTQADASLQSPSGALHMAGNVWEWTADWYHRDAYREGPTTDPTGPASGTWKTLRGGSYMNLASYCTCSHREPARPERVAYTTGFRCAYSP